MKFYQMQRTENEQIMKKKAIDSRFEINGLI